MDSHFRLFHLFLLIVFCAFGTQAQQTDSTFHNIEDSTIIATDSLTLSLDSTELDSLSADSLSFKPKRKSPLEYPVNYEAVDSMIVDLDSGKVYLFGEAVASYDEITLEADYIEIELDKSELMAKGLPDSNGNVVGLPIFTQAQNVFRSQEMRYNFKSKKGLSKDVKTQESEGYLHGDLVKRDTGEVIYIKDGKYTTCEYDEPHFHIHANKMKVISGDKIITGPAYLSIANIPTPLALPFGYFPNSDQKANGIIIPSYGQTARQGFFLSRGGYYLGINDFLDLTLTGDIYTRGSWATYLSSNYKKRYKYRGNLELSYANMKFGIPEFPDFSEARSFNVRWNHNQDQKARPNSTFSADVNAGSSQNFRNNAQASQNDFLRSTLASSVNYAYNFPNLPFNFNVSGRSSQNTRDSTISLNLPTVAMTMARINPFRSKTGKKNIITDINMSAKLRADNRLLVREDTLFTENTFRNMDNGVELTIPISTNFKLLKFITVSPSIQNRFVGYLKTTRQNWNFEDSSIVTSFNRSPDGFWEGNARINANTSIYGTYQFGDGFVKAMRHTMRPNVSVSWKPDYSEPQWGYYEEVIFDTNLNTRRYGIFQGQIYGQPGSNENGVISFGVNNNLDAKIRDREDTTSTEATKKISVFDALNVNGSYRFLADSFNLSQIRFSFRTQIIKGLTFNANAQLDPYSINKIGQRISEFQFDRDQRLGRWTSAGITMSWRLQAKEKEKPKQQKESETERKKKALEEVGLYYTDFVDFDVPWSLNFNYNFTYTKPGLESNIINNLRVRGDINLTQNWKIGFDSGFDFAQMEVTNTSINIFRNLHCWELTFRAIPFGPQQRYDITINVKSALLQDLKLNRNRNFSVPPSQL